jgi:hypothetical protein
VPQTIYLTAWRDSHMLPEGFHAVVRPEAFRWDDSAESRESDAAELEARLNLALALLESVGIEAHFSSEPGDAYGDGPEDGYSYVGVAVPGGGGGRGELP